MSHHEATPSIPVKPTTEPTSSEAKQILVVDQSYEGRKQVEQLLAGLMLDGTPIGYVTAGSVVEAQQILASPLEVAVVLLVEPAENSEAVERMRSFVRSIAQNSPTQVVVYTADLAAFLACQDISTVKLDEIRLLSDLNEDRLRIDLTLALKRYETLATFRADNRKLRETGAAQAKEVDRLQRVACDASRFSTILEATSDFVGIARSDGQIVYTNPAGRKLLGIGPDEDITQFCITDLYSEETGRQMMAEVIPRAMQQGIEQGEFSFVARDGHERLVHQVIITHYGPNGEVEFVSTIARDITKYKRLEASLRERKRFLQLVMDSIPQFIYWKDRQSVFMGCNRNFARVAGLESSQEIRGKTDYDLPWGDSEAEFYQMQDYEIMERDQPEYHIIETQLHEDGTFAWLDTNKIPLHDDRGRVIGILGTYEDITKRVEAETALQIYSERLEDMVEERTQELSQALEELKEAQQQLVEAEKMAALGSLVAGVAHEINTPVGVGVTAASTLRDETELFSSAVQSGKLRRSMLEHYIDVAQESSRLILRNLNRAAELVRSFKQVAVDQTNLEQRSFAVKPYIEEVLRSLSPQLKKAGHRVEVVGDEQLEVDSFPGAFAQLVTNLVMNSLLHAYPQSKTGCLQFSTRREREKVVLEYSDDGCGISAENLSKIFEPFFSTARGRGGTGLGLHIVYNLVTQKLGGTIRCESEVGQFTKFIVQLPLEAETKVENGS